MTECRASAGVQSYAHTPMSRSTSFILDERSTLLPSCLPAETLSILDSERHVPRENHKGIRGPRKEVRMSRFAREPVISVKTLDFT